MDTNTILLAIVSSSAMASLVSGLFNLVINKRKKEDGLEAGVRILLYDRLKHLGTSYIDKQEITNDELEDFIKMHSVYHNNLNGNGFLDAILEQVKKLPRVRKENNNGLR